MISENDWMPYILEIKANKNQFEVLTILAMVEEKYQYNIAVTLARKYRRKSTFKHRQ